MKPKKAIFEAKKESIHVHVPHEILIISEKIIMKTQNYINDSTSLEKDLRLIKTHKVNDFDSDNEIETQSANYENSHSKRKIFKIKNIKKKPENKKNIEPKIKTMRRKKFQPKLNREKIITEIMKFELRMKEIEKLIQNPEWGLEEQKDQKDIEKIDKSILTYKHKLKEIITDFSQFLRTRGLIPKKFENLISREYLKSAQEKSDYFERMSKDVKVMYSLKNSDFEDQKRKLESEEELSEDELLFLFVAQNLGIKPKLII